MAEDIRIFTNLTFFFKDRFSTQVIDTPFEEREDFYQASEDTSMTPHQSTRPRSAQPSLPSSSDASGRPSHAAIARIANTPVSYSPAATTRPAEPMSPGVGLVIGTEPDPVSY